MQRIRRDLSRALVAGLALALGTIDERDILSRLWPLVMNCRGALRLTELQPPPSHPQPVQNRLYMECVRIVRRRFPGAAPVIRCADPAALLAAAARRERIVLISLHSLVSTATYRFLADRDLAFCAIAIASIDPNTGLSHLRLTAGTLGYDSDLDIIASDADCFLHARRALVDGRIVCCAPDWSEGPDEFSQGRRRLVLAPALFEFCRHMRASVFYSVASVTADGALDVNLSGPHRYSPKDDIAERVAHFMTYAEGATGMAPDYRLARKELTPSV